MVAAAQSNSCAHLAGGWPACRDGLNQASSGGKLLQAVNEQETHGSITCPTSGPLAWPLTGYVPSGSSLFLLDQSFFICRRKVIIFKASF